MKSAVRDRHGLMPSTLKPMTAEAALCAWYEQGLDESGLPGKAHLLINWLSILAASEDEGGPLPYSIAEMSRRFNWPDVETRHAAECAAAAGFLRLDGDRMILTDPRTRAPR